MLAAHPHNPQGIVDVVVNIAAAPATQVLGSPVAYTLSLQNVGRLTSRGNNGFVVRLQPGVNVTGLPTAQYGAPPRELTEWGYGAVVNSKTSQHRLSTIDASLTRTSACCRVVSPWPASVEPELHHYWHACQWL
jgi:hypothetical protein